MKNLKTSISLSQGDVFNNVQQNISNYTAEKQTTDMKESFATNDGSGNQLSDVSQNDKLLFEYKNLIKLYTKTQQELMSQAANYEKTISPKNPLLGKNIKVGTGIFYVTNMGVAKWYPSKTVLDNTAGLNGCPSSTNIDTTYSSNSWNNAWESPGAVLPTVPTLITGTPMVQGQACGYAGENVYVNSVLSNTSNATYDNCYINNPNAATTWYGGSPPTPLVVQNQNFSSPSLSNNSYNGYGTTTSPDSSSIPGWSSYGAFIINNSTAWGYTMPYPNGPQCASIQQTYSISQTFYNVAPGTFTLSLQACGRNCCDGSGLCNPIDIQLNGTTFYTINVPVNVWTAVSTSVTISQAGTNIITFQGTYSAGDRSTAIQNIKIISGDASSSSGAINYDDCKQQAELGGYQYFALQDVSSSSSTGYCLLTNDYVGSTTLGLSTSPTQQIILWSSNTSSSTSSNPGSTATLTSVGSLEVLNSSGSTVYSTPGPNNSSFYGCYTDAATRAISTMYNNGASTTYSDCLQAAQNNGSTLFGWQYVQSNNTGQCFLGTDINQARQYGLATNCFDSSGNAAGGGWSNAVYGVSPGLACYLICEDSGNVAVYRGTGPSDNQGQLWTAGITGQSANPNFAAANGAYTQNWIPNGTILSSGQWVGNTSGSVYLIMQSDGNLVAYTFQMGPSCATMDDGNMGAGPNANALYKLPAAGTISNVGAVAYVDPNNDALLYSSDNIGVTNNYTTFENVNNPYGTGGDGTVFSNISQQDCETTCNNQTDCYGYILTSTNASSNTCYLKASAADTYPSQPLTPQDGWTTYIRNKAPSNVPKGASRTTTNIDSNTYSALINKGNLNMSSKYGMSQTNSVKKQQLSQIEDRLNSLSQQLGISTMQLDVSANQLTSQAIANDPATEIQIDIYNKSKKKIKSLAVEDVSMTGILQDSDINVLKDNYNYIFWTILAMGLILVALSVSKKK
jgi:hypothetical protein